MIKTLEWIGGTDAHVKLIDQTLLPGEMVCLEIQDVETMWEAIKVLRVRGAPAIGVAAAFGAVLGVQNLPDDGSLEQAREKLDEVCDYLATSRPTAVNLFWALERMQRVVANEIVKGVSEFKERLLAEAQTIRDEDAEMCRAIGRHGADLIKTNGNVLTHCNAGGLATSEYGTALALMFAAHEDGRRFHVYVDETRPLLQGSRLTAWELQQAGIDATLVCDNMAGHLMQQGKVDLVVTGADRIAANGDAANKIGTYSLAVLAKAHEIPFYIAAPSSTFDLSIPDGSQIPIEQRGAEEVTSPGGVRMAPEGVAVYNPAFDVTPHGLIAAIITEKGIINNPDTRLIKDLLAN
jgi:methylthioribose-1-phosphate isomerase